MKGDELNKIVETASQKGITVTCKEMKSALPTVLRQQEVQEALQRH